MKSAHNLVISAISLISIMLVSVSFVLDEGTEMFTLIRYIDNMLCIVFLCDFLYNVAHEDDKVGYIFGIGILDLVSCVPVLEQFRYARIIRIFRFFRIVKCIALARSIIVERKGMGPSVIMLVSISTLIASAIGILHFEKDLGNIKTASDALWWAFVSVTTVGYGDFFPKTNEGRIVSVLLITVGIMMYSLLTAHFVNTFKAKTDKGRSKRLKLNIEELMLLEKVTLNELGNTDDPVKAAKLAELYHRMTKHDKT